jgi:hypothetical protein
MHAFVNLLQKRLSRSAPKVDILKSLAKGVRLKACFAGKVGAFMITDRIGIVLSRWSFP